MLRIIIITDSRGSLLADCLSGRGLAEDYSPPALEELGKLCLLTVKVYKGATVERLENKLPGLLREKQYHLIVLLAGICNLPTVTKERQLKLLHYISEPERIDTIKQTFTRLDHKYKDRLHISRIIPACLSTYFKHHNKDKTTPAYLETQQVALLDDIEEINSFITSINSRRGQERLDLDKKLVVQSRKTSKTKTGERRKRTSRQTVKKELLPDGVHPSLELAKKWVDRLLAVLLKWAEKKTEEIQASSSQESESDNERRAWRFKGGRGKANHRR